MLGVALATTKLKSHWLAVAIPIWMVRRRAAGISCVIIRKKNSFTNPINAKSGNGNSLSNRSRQQDPSQIGRQPRKDRLPPMQCTLAQTGYSHQQEGQNGCKIQHRRARDPLYQLFSRYPYLTVVHMSNSPAQYQSTKSFFGGLVNP